LIRAGNDVLNSDCLTNGPAPLRSYITHETHADLTGRWVSFREIKEGIPSTLPCPIRDFYYFASSSTTDVYFSWIIFRSKSQNSASIAWSSASEKYAREAGKKTLSSFSICLG